MSTKGNPHDNNVGSESNSDGSDSSSPSSSESESEWSGSSGERSKRLPKTKRQSRITTPRHTARTSRLVSSHSHTPQHFSVTASGDTGLKLKIAAIPTSNKHQFTNKSIHDNNTKPSTSPVELKTPERKTRNGKQKKKSVLSESSSCSDTSCSDFSTSEGTDSELNTSKKSIKSLKVQPKATPKLSVTVFCKGNLAEEANSDVRTGSVPSVTPSTVDSKNVKSTKNETTTVKCCPSECKKVKKESSERSPEEIPEKRVRGRPTTKAGAVSECVSTSSSSSSSVSSSPSSSSSDSDTADSNAATDNASSDDSSAALAAACSLQVIDDEDLAALLPEQGAAGAPMPTAPANTPAAPFTPFVPSQDDKSVQDTGDGSSSEMEIPAQLVTAAIQRATADSSGSENECSNPGLSQTSTTHYASSLLQQFVAQTQLLNHSTSISTINPVVSNPIENVTTVINDCILPEIPPIASNFLTDDHLTSGDGQHLSPQQTEELRQINKDLAEITSHSESLSIPNPPILDDCVDNSDFIAINIPQSSSDFTSDNVKSSPILLNDDIAGLQNLANNSDKDEYSNLNTTESQEDSKSVIEDIKRKRGRPRKSKDERSKNNAYSKDEGGNHEKVARINNILPNDFCLGNDPPNVSPDSGILSNHNSPSHSPIRKPESCHSNKNKSRKYDTKDTARSSRSTSKVRSRGRSKTRDRSMSSEASFKRKPLLDEMRTLKVETPSPTPSKQNDRIKKNESKLDIAALDRMLYATDRVLYPPRRKVGRPSQNKNLGKKGPGRPAKNKCIDSADSDSEINANRSVLSEVYAKRKDLNKMAALTKKCNKSSNSWREHQSDVEAPGEDPLDPTWRQIDLNPKYRDILSGYKSDHDIKPYKSCSRLIESGYKSDYGFRCGYKSDHGCKSGYKTDHRSGYKSDKSGYKSDHSIRNMRKRMRKMKKSRSVRDRSYYKNQKYFVTDQEILLLANKTFSCLALGHSTSDSDSDFHSISNQKEIKFQSACTKFRNLSVGAKFGFGSSNYFHNTKYNTGNAPDPFAPGPVFSAFNARIPSSSINLNLFQTSAHLKPFFSKPDKHLFGGSPVLGHTPVFVHKFACSPISKKKEDSPNKIVFSSVKKDIIVNNNHIKHYTQNTIPKVKKSSKTTENTLTVCKRERSPPLVDIFEKARNTYVPNKVLARNVFLNIKKPQKKNLTTYKKKHKKQSLIITPTKINLKAPRLSRITTPSSNDSRHQRHKLKRYKRSRSLSKPRDFCVKQSTEIVDPKFIEEMDNLVSYFIKLCYIVPKVPPQQVLKIVSEKPVTEGTPKSVKRFSKKRKGSDNNDVPIPTSKRRHKKQQTESQTKGNKDKDTSANEHKLPLKKRHYHINCSTNSSLSLSFISSEFGENFKSENSRPDDAFECTETNCLVDIKEGGSPEKSSIATKTTTKSNERHKKPAELSKVTGTDTPTDAPDLINIPQTEKDVKVPKTNVCLPTTIATKADHDIKDDFVQSTTELDIDIQIEKPTGEPSELSMKIYETSEKLKAVHKMVHDLEKSLPKIKESDIKDSKETSNRVENGLKEFPKCDSKNASPDSMSSKTSSAPIVTPKKRHRLEIDKTNSNSPLDQVVQSLTKKLSEDKVIPLDKDKIENKSSNLSPMKSLGMETKKITQTEAVKKDTNIAVNDTVKTLSSRTVNKNVITNKSDIMTRKKIRLEGLTSNLVSKINPSNATKMLDSLMNNNLRKSIESKINDKTRETVVEVDQKYQEDSKVHKDSASSTPRATVIKSPVSKLKLPAEAKKLPKGTDILIEETVVINVEKPTGIFEPSIDIELQIPKSSISVANQQTDVFNKTHRPGVSIKSTEKSNSKAAKTNSNTENEIPLTLTTTPHEADLSPRKRSESIASLICDKIQESGHNLRQTKRSSVNDNDKKADDPAPEKRKKKSSNILRESKLSICPQTLPVKNIADVFQPLSKVDIKKSDIENIALKNLENIPSDSEKSIPLKKRAKRRKAINRTGFPSVKKKKKKLSMSSLHVSISGSSDILSSESVENLNSVFERVPKDGEAMNSFLERTTKYKTGDLKVVLNKEECPKQGRLSVISLERLQGKKSSESRADESTLTKLLNNCLDSDNESQPLSKLTGASHSLPKCVQNRRKSRMSHIARKLRDVTPSSRDSSIETIKTFKRSPKSRETSVDTIKHFHDQCEDPLPLNEKEIDFEKSVDVLSKNIINKKRGMSSRDDSPASSVEGFKISDKERLKRNPRLRKKYLVAGLFSDYYKTNDPKTLDPKAKYHINLADHPKGLLAPPPYCERWIRQRKQHFQLPYDIWWQHHYNQPVPSWNYRKIRTNVYYDVKPSTYGCEAQACNCSPSSGCPDDCINRLVYSECSSQLCPCKELCKNQRIQKHDCSPGLEKFMTESKGWGVRTKMPIKMGEFILEYVGEVVSDKEFKERMAWRYARDTHHYCLHLDGGLVIDGHRMGGDGRFVNHSCLPNCEMQKWSANGTFRMALFALRNIRAGEELTYDYNFSLFNPAEGQPCKCESDNCRGVIGGKSQRVSKPSTASKLISKVTSTAQGSSGASTLGGGSKPQIQVSSSSPNRVGRPRKAIKANRVGAGSDNVSAANLCEIKNSMIKYQQQLNRLWQEPQMKPLTPKERFIIRDRHCFLIKNLQKVKRIRDRLSVSGIPAGGSMNGLLNSLPANVSGMLGINSSIAASASNPSVFLTRLHTLRTPRSIKTRRLAQAEDNPLLNRQARLADVFKELYNYIVTIKDEKGDLLCKPLLQERAARGGRSGEAAPLPLNLPSVLANIESGHYKTVAHFDTELNGLFSDAVRTEGRLSPLGLAALHLKKMYNNTKQEFAEKLSEIIGPEEGLPVGFVPKRKPEEVIMCICGLHFEEGLMVQCSGEPSEQPECPRRGCGVWQHAHCMGVAVTDTSQPYYCHKCQPRKVDLEIHLDEYTDEGHQFYLSLMRGTLQVRQGDTVYVLRDIPIDDRHPDRSADKDVRREEPPQSISTRRLDKRKRLVASKDKIKTENKPKPPVSKASDGGKKATSGEDQPKHTYKTIGDIAVSELDIFRVERLWKHKDTGERYVYGHHYLRPHETYHEPTRKFFPNEVMRVPLYEAVPIDLVMSQCWVLDVNTYCKGRPVGAVEDHVYISELRVDRSARLFTKISRPKYPICTKSYAFDTFPQRLRIFRTYAPHEVSPEFLKGRGRAAATTDREKAPKQAEKEPSAPTSGSRKMTKERAPARRSSGQPLALPHLQPKNRERQKRRLNGILLALLARLPSKRPLDVSYLLDGRRQRKKTHSS